MEPPKRTSDLHLETSDWFPVIRIQGYFEEELAIKLVATVEDLLRQEKTALVLDFAACTAINSLAVGQLQFLTMKIVEDFHGTLVLAQISPVMVRVFELASITPFALVAPDAAAAVARLKGLA